MALDSKMQNAFERLRELSQRLASVRRPGWGNEASHLEVKLTEVGLSVHWLLNEDAFLEPGEGEEIFAEIFRVLASADISPYLASLILEGHQIACNGTIDWEVGPIAYASEAFERLRVFQVKSFEYQGAPCSAGTLTGSDWKDKSIATRFLERMPVLEELAIPEPPGDEEFFKGPTHPLKNLEVFDTDYNSFIRRLAECKRFPNLEQVCFRESVRTDVNPRLSSRQYVRWFESDSFPSLRVVKLAQVDLCPNDLKRLRETRIGRQLSRLEVIPVESWCDRAIMRAPVESTDDD